MRWCKQIITKHLRRILNAWQFQFKSALVLNVAKFRFGWSRCSPLNAALEVLGMNMGRRRELGSIASGIIGSFRSRNNDVDGYWGIGKLYLLVEHLQSKCISINLCSQQIAPYSRHFDLMTEHYSKMFKGLLTKRSIPLKWVSSAYVYVEFEADYE